MVALKGMAGIAICILFIGVCTQKAHAEVRWEQHGETWYCYDDNNVPLSGWLDYNGESYCMDINGMMLTSQITSDGRYVDRNGEVITYDDCKDMFNQIEQSIMNGNSNSDIYISKVSQAIDITKFKNNENKEMQDVVQKLYMFNKEVNMSDELAFYIRVTDNQDNYSVRIRCTDAELQKWKEEQKVVNSALDSIAKDLQGLSDREKFDRIVNVLCNNLRYDYSLTNTSAYDGLTGNGTVCNGHMKLFFQLARKAGLESKVVLGYANGELHGWNQIKLDGVWYHTDLTWYVSAKSNEFLILSDQELSKRSIIQIYE